MYLDSYGLSPWSGTQDTSRSGTQFSWSINDHLTPIFEIYDSVQQWTPSQMLPAWPCSCFPSAEQVRFLMSCSSPRWENLPSGHQRYQLKGPQFRVHVLGSKTLFWINWNIPIHAAEIGACIDMFFFWYFKVRNRYPKLMAFFREVMF